MSNKVSQLLVGTRNALQKGVNAGIEDPLATVVTVGANVGYETAAAGADDIANAGKPGPTPALPVMPTADSELVRQARRRQAAAMRSRGGRASTILTGGSDTLGG